MTTIQFIATFLFAIAVLHTFFTNQFLRLSHRFDKDHFLHGFFHLLGEIEVVFGFWAAVLLTTWYFIDGSAAVIQYQQGLNFTEPLFVFCIMVICASRPILYVGRMLIFMISQFVQKILPIQAVYADYFVLMVVGPLLGSFITEPAAMTIVALLLNSMLKEKNDRVMYLLMAVLFVNISIGGALTTFAAPPILMVASKWNWDNAFVFGHFGWKAFLGVVLNALFVIAVLRQQLKNHLMSLTQVNERLSSGQGHIPLFVVMSHLLVLVLVVLNAHYSQIFMGLFMMFLGLTTATKRFQDTLRIREGLLVAFFLGGIIVFGQHQQWWLTPLLTSLNEFKLFAGATMLTAITDNAALTYLGSLVPNLSEASKIALVEGAIAGGGLTVIANAPNPAGFAILQNQFKDPFSPVQLLKAATIPTIIVCCCFWLIP